MHVVVVVLIEERMMITAIRFSKDSGYLLLWSGLFIDGPKECPAFCILFGG